MTDWGFGTLNLSVSIRYNLPYIFLNRLSQMLGSYYTMSSIGVGGVSTTESLSNAISLAEGNSSRSGGLSTAITPAIPPRTTADEEVSEMTCVVMSLTISSTSGLPVKMILINQAKSPVLQASGRTMRKMHLSQNEKPVF